MNDSAFLELCARVLDGTASAGDLRTWNDHLATNPRQRQLYRDFCGQQVWLEEELAGGPEASATQTLERRIPVGRLAAAAAVLVAFSAWWWNRSERIDRGPLERSEATASAPEAASEAPSAFIYPFDGFPNLQVPPVEPDATPELRVVALDGIDPRIVTIAQQLAGSGLSREPEL